MNDVLKVVGAVVVLVGAVVIAITGPALALSMAYLMWGWKGALFTLGLLLAK